MMLAILYACLGIRLFRAIESFPMLLPMVFMTPVMFMVLVVIVMIYINDISI
jgi:hypothetical protein